MHHSAALARETGGQALPEAVVSGQLDELEPRLRALLEYAVALTVSPRTCSVSMCSACRTLALSAREVIDANQVVAYFDYVDRVAEGLGVELEDHWSEQARRPRQCRLRKP